MSFLDKLTFWKKHDDFGLPPDMGSMAYSPETSSGSEGIPNALPDLDQSFEPGPVSAKSSLSQPLGFERPTQGYTQSQGLPLDREIEMISLKLDAIKAELDAMNQRLVRVEKLTELTINRAGKQPRDVWATY